MKAFPLGVGLLWLFAVTLSAQQVTHHTIYFDFDKYELTTQAKETLSRLATQLDGLPDFSIEVQAHTDARGTDSYNKRLAEQRAQAVLRLLTDRRIPVEKTTVQSFGESQPAYANDDEQSRQLNRRVDVIVTSWSYGSVDELFGRLSEDPRQTFEIDPCRSVRVTGREGTTIWAPAGSFVLEDGAVPEGPVTLTLQEAYERSDMILQNLHTTAGDRLLETGGMFYLDASADGRPLQLREDANLTVAMPAGELVEGMQLFRGTTDPEGGLADWEATGQGFSNQLEDMLDMPPRPQRPFHLFFEPAFQLDRSGEPVAPEKPRPPFEPHEPRRESFKYHPGFFKRLFTSKEKREAIEEQRYQQALEEYREKQARYEEKMLAHKEALQQYEQKREAYREAYAAWEESLEQQRADWQQSPAYLRAQEINRRRNEQIEAAWQDSLAAWNALREERLLAFENQYEAVGNLNSRAMNRYFYRVNTLGWINCDRFWEAPEEQKEPLVIRDSGQEEERIFVVFESLNSIVEMRRSEQLYTSGPLPKDEPVRIIGMRVKEGRAQLAVRKMAVAEGREEPIELKFEDCKLKDIRAVLAEI